MKFIFCLLLIMDFSFAKTSVELKRDLNQAKTNYEMKKISKDITKSYEKELSSLVLVIKKKLKGDQLKSFIKSQNNFQKYYESEDEFLMYEFGQREKHGSSASLTGSSKKNEILESRLSYLKRLVEAI